MYTVGLTKGTVINRIALMQTKKSNQQVDKHQKVLPVQCINTTDKESRVGNGPHA